jgi:hypothetical protein
MTDSSVRAEASRLLEKITPGEWSLHGAQGDFTVLGPDVQRIASLDARDRPESMQNAEFIVKAPRLLRALLAEGPDPETITRLQQLVETWTERQQTATERAKVAANYEDDDESPLPMGWEFYRGVETGIRDCAKDLSDLLTGLAASQEKKAPTREQEQP